VLTGWSIYSQREREPNANYQPGDFIFRTNWHDHTANTVMGFHVAANSGLQGGEAAVDYLAHHPGTARYISSKLAKRFVADAPPEALVAHLAEVFEETGGDVRMMLRAMIASPGFAASAMQKVKRPLEYFISLLRVTGAKILERRRSFRELGEVLRLLGQVPYSWSPPDGYPDRADWWLSTSGMLTRWNFAFLAVSGGLESIQVDLEDQVAEAGTAADVVDLLSLRYLGLILPDDARDILLDVAGSGDLNERLPAVAALILASPYFQVR